MSLLDAVRSLHLTISDGVLVIVWFQDFCTLLQESFVTTNGNKLQVWFRRMPNVKYVVHGLLFDKQAVFVQGLSCALVAL